MAKVDPIQDVRFQSSLITVFKKFKVVLFQPENYRNISVCANHKFRVKQFWFIEFSYSFFNSKNNKNRAI